MSETAAPAERRSNAANRAAEATAAATTRRTLWRDAGLALVLGALSALALPPVHALPLLLGFAVLLQLARQAASPRAAFLLGWAFGFGHHTVGLYWVALSFFVDAEKFGALAIPAVAALTATMALTSGLSAALIRALNPRRFALAALLFALIWPGLEHIRGALTLFPWNPLAVVWAFHPLPLQPLAWLGTLPYSVVTLLIAALLGAPLALRRAPGVARLALSGAVMLALLLGAAAWRLTFGPAVSAHADLRLRLVQPNIPQSEKWAPDKRPLWLERLIALSVAETGATRAPDHVIWPETAAPYMLSLDPQARGAAASAVPPGGLLLTGADRFNRYPDPTGAFNSLHVMQADGAIIASYDKVNLVPFGEFLPFRALLSPLGLDALAAGALDFVPGDGRTTLTVPGLPPFSTLICYEAAFPGAAIDPAARPAWLLNVTNDAWFGTSSGPYQHLAHARMRAVEEGLPLVRVANTGISAVIDPYGRITSRLGLNAQGVIDTDLPRPLPAPLGTYFRTWRQELSR